MLTQRRRLEEAITLRVQIRTETYNLVLTEGLNRALTEGFNLLREQDQIIRHNRLHVRDPIIILALEEVVAQQEAVVIMFLLQAGPAVQPTQRLHARVPHQP